ncbi:MAG TPA: glycosyltransferase, partial [Coleofasciculaceae cyanobacterium]
ARRILNLPEDKHLILFGALRATQDKRKGFHLLCSALKQLSNTEWQDKIEVVVFGSSAPAEPIDIGFKTHYLGHLQDDVTLVMAYSAASVMIVPSLQEAFGQTASEAMACGTPVVSFDQTGVSDVVDHQLNGYLARPFEVNDLVHGIAWVLEDCERYGRLCRQSRTKVEQEFSFSQQADRYLRLYTSLLNK